MDIPGMMKQAQKLQEQMANMQEQLGSRTVQAASGGGMVTVVANGRQEIVSVRIAPEIAAGGDVGMLQDLVAAAVNEALRSSRNMMQEELGKLTGGLKIPGITT